MRALVLALTASLALFAACATPPTASSAATTSPADLREIEAVIRAQEVAWNRGDVEGYMRAGYWDSPELNFFSGGEVTKGFEPVLQHYVKSYRSEGKEMGHLTFSGLELVPLARDAGMARGRWQLAFEKKPGVGGLFTLILRRTPQGWRIVHDHTSVDAK